MKSFFNFLSLRKNFDSFLFAIAGWLLIFFFTRHGGIGLSPDSIVYISTAKHIAENGSFTACNLSPMTDFPAFYPFFLSVIIFITKQYPVIFGTLLNCFLFSAVLYFSGCILQRFITPSRLYKNLILLCILCSHTLIEIYYMLWSETLLILFLLLFFVAFKRYARTYKLLHLLYAALIVSLACVTRYAGITLLGTGCLLILFDKQLAWKKKFIHLSVFFTISISLLVINLIHNYINSGFLTGAREKGITPLIVNIKNCGVVICGWFPFLNENYQLAIGVAIFVFILFCILFLKNIFSYSFYYSYENIALAFFITYAVFILAIATLTHFETLNSRLLSPLYMPFLWSISYPVVSVVKKNTSRLKPVFVALSVLLAGLFVWNELLQTYDLYDDASTNGIPGYNDDSWQSSAIVSYLRDNKKMFSPSTVLYSDDVEAVYFFTGHYCEQLPHYVFKKEMINYQKEEPHYVIWFENTDNPNLFHLPNILQSRKTTPVKIFTDGCIYWCEKKI